MIPKARYETLDPEEKKYWHSHEFEVKSGMLVLPYPESHQHQKDKWDELETQAMQEVVTLVCFWDSIQHPGTTPLLSITDCCMHIL